jgi:hypothetical protein
MSTLKRITREIISGVLYVYRHIPLIVSISLSIVYVCLYVEYSLPADVVHIVEAVEVVEDNTIDLNTCDYVCLTREWVELRTDELIDEGMSEYRLQMRTKALLEANALLTEI